MAEDLVYTYDATGADDFFGVGDSPGDIDMPEHATKLPTVSYVDDLAIPVIGAAETIVQKTARATEIAFLVFS